MELEQIEALLISEGFKVTPEIADINGAAHPKLSVEIELDGEDKDMGLVLELMFVPGVDDELDNGCRLLQFFIVYLDSVEDVDTEKIEELAAVVAELNFDAPLGTFGVRPADQMLFYKHMMMLPADLDTGTAAALSETLWLMAFVQNQCYPLIAGVLE